VGTVWFRPRVFGNAWQSLTGVDPNAPRTPAFTYTASFVAAAVTATALDLAVIAATGWWDGSRIALALVTATTLWAGFTLATSAVHYLFEGRPGRLLAINSGHQLATLMVMATILGLLTR